MTSRVNFDVCSKYILPYLRLSFRWIGILIVIRTLQVKFLAHIKSLMTPMAGHVQIECFSSAIDK